MESHKGNRGIYSEEELFFNINQGKIKYVVVCIPLLSVPRYKTFEAKYFLENVLNSTFRYPESFLNLNAQNDFICTEKMNLEIFRDIQVVVDKSTIRNMSWCGVMNEYAICIGTAKDNENIDLNSGYPRNVLIKTIEKAKNQHGINFLSASELEFYVLKTTAPEIVKSKSALSNHLISERNSDFGIAQIMTRNEKFTKVFKENLLDCGITLEGLFSEHGPGQHEVNIKYCETLKNCDNHTYLKQCIKESAYEMGLGATFMAKPFENYSGSSCHVHISAYQNGQNIFSPPANKNDPEFYTVPLDGKWTLECNIKMMYFIGGILKYLESLFILYAPTINSYKRYKMNSFAPCYINTWCRDSKFSSVKVIDEGEKIHLEIRVGGSDVNPYLIHTAIISSGMKGIEDKILPPEIQLGNIYQKTGLVAAPSNLYEASKLFKESSFAEEVFGKDFKETLYNYSLKEWQEYMDHVSSWEINRLLDLI